jgi:hypothetical protein
MDVRVNFIDIEVRSKVRAKIVNGTLIYIAKVKVLAAFSKSAQWSEVDRGYLALSSVGSDNAFFTLVDYDTFQTLMVHELYFNFPKNYTKVSPTVYAFPSDSCTLGFQFLLETEATEMQRQIEKTAPRKSRWLLSFFGKKGKIGAVVSMPSMESQGSRVEWDPQRGYRVTGSFDDLPKEQRKFVHKQRSSTDKKRGLGLKFGEI